MLGRKVGRKLDERGAEFVSEGQESIDEVVGWSVAVVEAAEVGDDLGKLGAKCEPIWHHSSPFCHAFGGVDAVVGGVEFQGSKLPAVVSWPRALGILLGINGTTPIADGPHGPTGFHLWLTAGRRDGQGFHAEAMRLNWMRPIDPVRCAFNLAKLHNSNLQPTAVSRACSRTNHTAGQLDLACLFTPWLEAELVVGRVGRHCCRTRWLGCVRRAVGNGLFWQTTGRVAFWLGSARGTLFLGWVSGFDTPPNQSFIA